MTSIGPAATVDLSRAAGPGEFGPRAIEPRGTEPVPAPAVRCRLATDPADLRSHHAIRRSVFVHEQAVFRRGDRDHHDDAPETLHVLGFVGGAAAGTVRLYPLDATDPAGCWQGDRLAVLPEFRARRLGAPLVEFAVRSAAARGGRRMLAHVQPSNGTFFRRLGWNQLGEELYVGLPHLLMDIDLSTLEA
jgi:putative N-acetyltransferase (TIGR04045 family)